MGYIIRHLISDILLAVLLLSPAMFHLSCISEDIKPDASISIGDTMPDFSIQLNDGSVLTSASLIGDVSMVVLFNTSCNDCRAELPIIESAQQRTQVKTVCISRSESNESIVTFWKENNLTLPYSAQPDDKIFKLFAASVIPRIYIFSSEGKVCSSFSDNPLPDEQQIVHAVNNARNLSY